MKYIIMDATIPLLFPVNEDGNYIVPPEYEFKQLENGINYLIKEIKL